VSFWITLSGWNAGAGTSHLPDGLTQCHGMGGDLPEGFGLGQAMKIPGRRPPVSDASMSHRHFVPDRPPGMYKPTRL